ncbi:hypothetical protein C8R43DRAFT_946106 [Mycena crocata]|nr:hypothetical protein C8R43DRAFT_946106 [Mycena crocata]
MPPCKPRERLEKRGTTRDQKSYKFKYDTAEKELLATPSSGSPVRFTPHRAYLFNVREAKPATIHFLPDMHAVSEKMHDANKKTHQANKEKMFLLMAGIKTNLDRDEPVGVGGLLVIVAKPYRFSDGLMAAFDGGLMRLTPQIFPPRSA